MALVNTTSQRTQLLNEARRHRKEAGDHRRRAAEADARALTADAILRRLQHA